MADISKITGKGTGENEPVDPKIAKKEKDFEEWKRTNNSTEQQKKHQHQQQEKRESKKSEQETHRTSPLHLPKEMPSRHFPLSTKKNAPTTAALSSTPINPPAYNQRKVDPVGAPLSVPSVQKNASPPTRSLPSLPSKPIEIKKEPLPLKDPPPSSPPKKAPLSSSGPKEKPRIEKEKNPIDVPIAPPSTAPLQHTYGNFLSSVERGSELFRLSADQLALFEKMVSVMSVMDLSGIQQTELYLNNPDFVGTALEGSKIVIREFSSAPKVFNIEIQVQPQGMEQAKAGLASLIAAFENGGYRFKVHQLEVSLVQEDKPVFHRKGKKEDEKDESQK